jgi:signal transduction histidine kinase
MTIDRRLLRAVPWGVGDLVVAFVLAATSVQRVLVGDPSWGRPESVGITLALASTVPVVWRHSRPVAAAAVVLIANSLCVFAATPYQAAFQPFVALVLVAYSLGSRAEGTPSLWVPPVLAIGAAPLFAAAVAHGQSVGNVIPSYVWLVAAWLVGRSAREWRLKSADLEEANRRLAEQSELATQAAVTIERGRIARELHDVVAHSVSMIVVQAGAASQQLGEDQPQVHRTLDVIAETGRQTVDEMRTLLGVLRSDDDALSLGPQPGLADLDQLVAGVRAAGLAVSLRVEGEQCFIPPALDLSAFRIVQEALTNTLRHGGRGGAEVVVRYGVGTVELQVVDQGPSGRGPAGGTGHGLIGMRERVLMFGGEFEAHPERNGFLVRALLPFGPPRPA